MNISNPLTQTLMIVFLISTSLACAHQKKAAVSPDHENTVIYFRFDDAAVLRKYIPAVEKVKTVLQQDPRAMIVLEGHTDQWGEEPYNLDLGDKRTRTVKAYLMREGIEHKRIITVPFGEDDVNSKSLQEQPKNRRVIMRYISPSDHKPAGVL